MPHWETDEQERLFGSGGWFGTSLDEASVKPRWKTHWERLLIYGLKLNFHRYIGQLRRLSSPYQKTPWRPLFVCKWRHVRTTTTCTPSDSAISSYAHWVWGRVRISGKGSNHVNYLGRTNYMRRWLKVLDLKIKKCHHLYVALDQRSWFNDVKNVYTP